MGSSLMLPELSRLSLWEPGSRFVTALAEQRRPMTGLNELRAQGRMTWIEQEHGWVAPEEIVTGTLEGWFELPLGSAAQVSVKP
jgi:hypothetical protein